MQPFFESLLMKKRSVILDTDIGGDCDDVGALALLHSYAQEKNVPILGVINCTSNAYANGCIDAINHYCKADSSIKIGAYGKPNFLDTPECKKYNQYVAEHFSEKFQNKTLCVTESNALYHELLTKADDNSVIIIAIGPLNTVADLVEEMPELVAQKVYALVSMAGLFPQGREYNVFCDAVAAQKVCETFPSPIFFVGFEVGIDVMTGFEKEDSMQTNPIYQSYFLYGDGNPIRNSWDLTTVQFAFEGEGDLYGLSHRGQCIVSESDGTNTFVDQPDGNHSIVTKKASVQIIQDSINARIRKFK